MLKFCYYSQEVYTFQNEDNLIKSFSLDYFQSGKLDIPNKIITYTINHSRCIRLSDLIFYIDIDFVRIQFGSFLNLILSLLEKVEYIESEGLQHEYLDMNRIWLYFQEDGQYPGLIYQLLDYSIHFTGYSCPLDKGNRVKQKASIEIKQIISEIIDKCYNRIRINQKKNKDKNTSLYKQVIQQIQSLCKSNSSNEAIIFYIQEIIDQYKIDQQKKSKHFKLLDIDDTDIDPIRQKAVDKVNNVIKQIIEIGNKYGQVYIELLLQDIIQSMTQNLKTFKFDPQYCENYAQIKFKRLENKELELKQLVAGQIKDQILFSLQKYEKDYKFNIDEEEINYLQCQIVDSILQSPEVKHFYNTYWFQKDDQINYYIYAAISNIQQSIIQDEVESLFMLQILQLVDDL
ncbi:unnamed protein product [Paramecium octaurelia]|uniref:Uncharacterized protein n=1 Tax=Paramecium octaurelia TaxID=43137 RepID=A0A8S1XZD5_PAROT|nr:unnamed protein product [Paramecium octaurelia]